MTTDARGPDNRGTDIRDQARTLRDRIEPLVGQVYFSPECHAAYEALGFAGSPAGANGVAFPDGPAYFTSRGSLMGQVPGEVVAAAFAVFNPEVVVPSVTFGWTKTDAETIYQARHDGAVAQLKRTVGDAPDGLERAAELLRRACEPLQPAGKALFAGTLSKPWPGDPWGDLFHAGDLLREYRGDAHTASWTAAGLDAVKIGLLTELFWGMASRSYIRTRAWSDEQMDVAEEWLRAGEWLDDDGLSASGRERREAIELATDEQMRPAFDALGGDVDELFALLEPWGKAVVAAGGYPSGPSDLMSGRHAR
jgi:hypothetical protein